LIQGHYYAKIKYIHGEIKAWEIFDDISEAFFNFLGG